MTEIKVYFNGETEMGCYIQNTMVVLPEDYTMNQLVTAIKNAGYTRFMLPTMKRLVDLPTMKRLVDVKEEVSETETNETTVETTAEQETVEGISKTETTTEMDDSGKDANNTDFQQQLYNAEYNKTFTVQGGIERFLKLAKEFVKNKSAEISLIVDTAAQVLHDKYGLDYGTIETLEIEAYNS